MLTSHFYKIYEKNENVHSYHYFEVVLDAGAVCQHVCSIVIFVCNFVFLYSQQITPQTLFITTTCLCMSMLCIAYWSLLSQTQEKHGEVIDDRGDKERAFQHNRKVVQQLKIIIKSGIISCTILLGLSPVLKTLTKDTGSDTIWALSVILLLTNAILHEYSSSNPSFQLLQSQQPKGSIGQKQQQRQQQQQRYHSTELPQRFLVMKLHGSLAMNAAIFASVVLASRLSSNMHVFSLMVFAVVWFALLPIFRQYASHHSKTHLIGVTGISILTAIILLNIISHSIAILFSLFVVLFLCPAWFIWLQRYKK